MIFLNRNFFNPVRYGLLVMTALCSISFDSFSQERCGTVGYQESLAEKNPDKESNEGFEQWLASKLVQRTNSIHRLETTVSIPVVVPGA